jgi:hypothetical protein
MIQEMIQPHYLGVPCSRCKQPIAVPKRAAILFEELQQGTVIDGQDEKARALTLRCKACDGEGVYGFKQIQEFQGAPRVRGEKRKSARA